MKNGAKIFNGSYEEESQDFSSVLSPHRRSRCWRRCSYARLRGPELSGVNSSHAGCKKRGVSPLAVMGLATDEQVRMSTRSEHGHLRSALLPVSHEPPGLQWPLGLGTSLSCPSPQGRGPGAGSLHPHGYPPAARRRRQEGS